MINIYLFTPTHDMIIIVAVWKRYTVSQEMYKPSWAWKARVIVFVLLYTYVLHDLIWREKENGIFKLVVLGEITY